MPYANRKGLDQPAHAQADLGVRRILQYPLILLASKRGPIRLPGYLH